MINAVTHAGGCASLGITGWGWGDEGRRGKIPDLLGRMNSLKKGQQVLPLPFCSFCSFLRLRERFFFFTVVMRETD